MSDQDSVTSWAPSGALVTVLWIGAALAAAWCALLAGTDPAGRLLAGCAAAGLLLGALFGTRARPRLQVDRGGLTVRGLLRARHHPWPLVRDVRVLRTCRWGRDSSLLEIDTETADGGERLLVFGRFDLGTDPEDVAPHLESHRP